MKKLIICAVVGLAGAAAYAQALVSMNTSSADQYVKFTNGAGANTFFYGADQIYVGLYWASDVSTLLAGGGQLVGLPPGATNTSPLAWLTGTSPTVGGFVATTTGGGNRQIASQAGLSTWFQLRAWSQKFGTTTLNSWNEALATGSPEVLVSLQSAPIDGGVLGTTPSDLPFVPKWNRGSTSAAQAIAIALYPVPEPSAIALVGLGLAGLLFIRRRK